MKRISVMIGTAVLAVMLAASVASAEQYVLKIATVAPKGTPWSKLLTRFKTNVSKASGGRIKVKLFLGGTMGDENATVRMAARGRIQGVGASTGALGSLIPELNAVEIPFMFRSAKEADYVLDKKLTDPMRELFREHGLEFGFWSENGFRHFGSQSKKISAPEDLRGQRMRSQESFVHLKMWEALKASPQAIPTTEVLTALKTGAVDGYDQALLYAIAAGWHNSAKHLTVSGHIYQPAVIAFNKEWFDSLPPDLQKIVSEEGTKIVRLGRKAIRNLNPELLGIIEGAGVKVHRLSMKERARFEEATQVVRKQFRKKYGKKGSRVLDLVEQGVAEFRSRSK